MDALTSDSYEIPGIIQQEEAAVRAAENTEKAWGQTDALESGAEADRAAREYETNRMTFSDQRAEETIARMNRIAANHPVQRATVRARPSVPDANVPDAEAAITLSNSLEGMRLALKRLEKSFRLSKADVINAREMAAGRGPVSEIPEKMAEKIESYTRLLRNYNAEMRPVYEYWQQVRSTRERAADGFVENSALWQDTNAGVWLDIRTPERVIRSVAGADAEAVIQAYIAPVHVHDAQKTRWENEQRTKLREILDGTTHEEQVYAHMKNRADELNRIGQNAAEKLKVHMDKYLQKHRGKINMENVVRLEDEAIAFTTTIHPEISETYVRNGYEPLEFRHRYVPSIAVTHQGGKLAQFLRAGLGIETKADELPTEIAGLTMDRRPGRKYAAFANERIGLNTEFDLGKALDHYVSAAGHAIFFTDDVQNLRALEERLRYKYSDEGTRAELDAVDARHDFDIEQKVQAKSELWERSFGNLPHFPTWLRKYTDYLAGKKALTDRGFELDTNRGFYQTVTDIEGKVAVNMTGFNFNTALTNLIALTQGGAEIQPSSMARATVDYAASLIHGDTSFHDISDFLTSRKGSERVKLTGIQKAQNVGFKPMEIMDDISSGILVRARYYDNLERGVKPESAMREADAWAAGLMGDRSTGAKPLIFEAKSPLKKAFTMFQLEVMNTFGHVLEDLPREMAEKGAAWLAGVLLKMMLSAYLFNDTQERITGSRSAPDPFGMINDFMGRAVGKKLPNTYDLIREVISGDLTEEDFEAEKMENLGDVILTTAQDVASELPFISGPVGALLGAGNSRVPIQSAVPDITKIIRTGTGEGTAQSKAAEIGAELAKPLLMVGLPVAGAQIKKTAEGLRTMQQAGSFGYDKEGRKQLKFPVYGQGPLDYVQSALFGPYSRQEARDYVDSGFKRLNADDTAVYQRLMRERGLTNQQAYEAIQTVRGTKSKQADISNMQAQRQAIMDMDLSQEDKLYLDKWLVGSVGGRHDVSYMDAELFYVTNYVPESQRKSVFTAMRQHGVDMKTAAGYAMEYSEAKKTGTVLKKPTYETQEKMLENIRADQKLTAEQKNGLIDSILLADMSDKWTGKQADKYLDEMDAGQRAAAQIAYNRIADEVKKDLSIHEKDKAAYKKARFAAYLKQTGLNEEQQDRLRYFVGTGENDLKETWSDIGRLGSKDEMAYVGALEKSGLEVDAYKIIKGALWQLTADKDSKGESVSGSKKKKWISYLNGRDDLTGEQKNLIMKMNGYKYGMGDKPKKAKQGLGLPSMPRLKGLPTMKW